MPNGFIKQLCPLVGFEEERGPTLYPDGAVAATRHVQLGDDAVTVGAVVDGDGDRLIDAVRVRGIILAITICM